MQITDFTWGGERAGRDLRRMGTISGPPQMRAVTVTRVADQVTPQILQLMLTNATTVAEIVWLRTGSPSPIPYMNLLLEGVQVTSSALVSAGEAPDETIVLTYSKMTLTVTNVGDSLDGTQDVVVYELPTAAGV